MARKKWEARTQVTSALIEVREKRKWQINLRRYVVDQSPCPAYAPYFGLDILHLREWFALQFSGDMSWSSFGKNWQFEHLLPLAYFDHTKEEELRLAWNFINLRVGTVRTGQPGPDLLGARLYFDDLFIKTGFPIALALRTKIEKLETVQRIDVSSQELFLLNNKSFLQKLSTYSAYDLELLNHGRSHAEIEAERAFLMKNNRE